MTGFTSVARRADRAAPCDVAGVKVARAGSAPDDPTGSLSVINNYSGSTTISGPILPTLAGPIRLAYFPEQCRPLEAVAVEGPVDLLVGERGWYTATYTPISATTPVTITWDNGTVGSSAAYSWTLPGSYTVAITVTNPCGWAGGTLLVEVQPLPVSHRIYVPLVWRR